MKETIKGALKETVRENLNKGLKETFRGRLAYIGAGAGLVCFAVFGLLPGSFLGGVMGLNIAGSLFGMPAAPGILARLIVAAFMLTGVMVSGLLFTVAGATAGWLAGFLMDAIAAARRHAVHATSPVTKNRL